MTKFWCSCLLHVDVEFAPVNSGRKQHHSGDRVSVLGFEDEPFSWEDLETGDFEEEVEQVERERDRYVDLAKVSIAELFEERPQSVFYQRQLQVLFEKKYFHWITVRALGELVEAGTLAQEAGPVPNAGMMILYRRSGHRYWKRDGDEVVKLVSRFSEPNFTRALGAHGEAMFDAALPRAGFMPKGLNAKKHRDIKWTDSDHNLDRIFERDGTAYGAEIKNTLGYIEIEELRLKIQMCRELGLIPLFIVRMAPKSYVKLVEEAGGFTLIFKYQLYPFGQKAFADEVREKLGLPTDSPLRIAEGTMKRLLDWHLKKHNLG